MSIILFGGYGRDKEAVRQIPGDPGAEEVFVPIMIVEDMRRGSFGATERYVRSDVRDPDTGEVSHVYRWRGFREPDINYRLYELK